MAWDFQAALSLPECLLLNSIERFLRNRNDLMGDIPYKEDDIFSPNATGLVLLNISTPPGLAERTTNIKSPFAGPVCP